MADNKTDERDGGGRHPLAGFGISFWLSLAWILFVAFMAISANWWRLPEPDYMDWDNPAAGFGTRGKAPLLQDSGERVEEPYVFWLGADTMGRDIITRIIFGARVSLTVGLTAPIVGMFFGGILGMLAGFYRGRLEAVVVASMDALLAFPGIVLLMGVTFYLGPSLRNLILALGILSIPSFCRVARASTLSFAEREFVQAARTTGAGNLTILIREILPNVLMPLAVFALLVVAFMIVVEGAMSFLGLGVPPPTASWGGMIAEGKEVLDEAPHVSMIPAAIMFFTVLSFNLIGDQLRELRDAREGQL
ncbi:MAG: ABC transporter permease [Desulfobacterales bacterium]|nr:ABC transporter permease [Desulfobacterales bacterium]